MEFDQASTCQRTEVRRFLLNMYPLHILQPAPSRYNTSSLKHILFTFTSTVTTIPLITISPRWSSFSSTYLLPYPSQMLLLTDPRLVGRQRKDLNRNDFVQFCQLYREEWHEALWSAWMTSPGPDTTVTAYFKFHHGHHQRRYIVKDNQEHELYFE